MSFEGRLLVPLREGNHRLRYAPGRSDLLLISFAGIGRRRRLMPHDEFVTALLAQPGAHCLLVSDRERTGVNAPALVTDLRRTVRSLREVDGVRRVVTIGAGLGGYAALAAAWHIPVDAALALSPPVSLLTDEVPEDARWRYWRRRIADPRPRSVAVLPEVGTFTLFHGTGEDAPHLRRFEAGANVDHFVLPGLGTAEVADRLGADDIMPGLVAAVAARDRDRVAELAAEAGAERR